MLKQMTFADAEYAGKRKHTRKELFLIEMDLVVPWKGLLPERTPLSDRRRRSSGVSVDGDAAGSSHAELVWLQCSGDGRGAVRYDDIAPDFRPEPGANPGRNHHSQLPSPAGKTRVGHRRSCVITGCLGDSDLSLRQGTIADAASIQAPTSTENKNS